MNHMIHTAATTQIRLDTQGLLPAQARRRQDPSRGHRGGSGRAPRGVTRIQRGRLTPAHRHFGSATSRTRTQDATRAGVTRKIPTSRHLEPAS
jgi:hypothetical protein